ncbi:MAG: carbohydrate ABC transporter permease [Lachnospiraceae bacterium]|jgi:multiple sugar transport system permease protein/putative aldouronate transport system permease protein|nr:carbohydrate ABC transporter permease [Lachnospiraceae bacterium]
MNKKKNKFSIANIINILILGAFTFICVYPLWYIFINSFSSPQAINRGVYFIPREFTLEAYKQMIDIPGLTSSIGIAFARTIIGTLLTLICCSFTAYLLSDRDLPKRKLIYRFFILTMYINAGFIPYYLTISAIGLKNNFLVYVLPAAVQAYFIILIKTYIESIPAELVESAEMDGAGLIKIYYRIILPLSKPILACIVVFAAVNQWNAWADDMYFMQGRKANGLHCLQYLLYTKLQSNVVNSTAGAAAGANMTVSSNSLRMAMSFVTVIPILCVYPYMQRFFTKGIMLGAVKG